MKSKLNNSMLCSVHCIESNFDTTHTTCLINFLTNYVFLVSTSLPSLFDANSQCPETQIYFTLSRFGKGNSIVDEMIEQGLRPDCKFYYDLIGVLCGVERVNFVVELFEKMKRSSLGGYGPVYDVLIPKLCRGGDFEKGRELWDEAFALGVSVSFSNDVLDPSITEVFKPTRKKVEEFNLKVVTATTP